MCWQPFTRSASPESLMLVHPCKPNSTRFLQFLERDNNNPSVTNLQPARCRLLRSWQPSATADNPLSVNFRQYDASKDCREGRPPPIKANPLSVIAVTHSGGKPNCPNSECNIVQLNKEQVCKELKYIYKKLKIEKHPSNQNQKQTSYNPANWDYQALLSVTKKKPPKAIKKSSPQKKKKKSPLEKKKKKPKANTFTFTILQLEDLQALESFSDDGKIRVSNPRIERPGNGLREVQLQHTCEPGSHPAEHVRSRTSGELLPLGTLQMQPSLADQTEHFLVLITFQPWQYRSQLVVRQCVVYANRGHSCIRHRIGSNCREMIRAEGFWGLGLNESKPLNIINYKWNMKWEKGNILYKLSRQSGDVGETQRLRCWDYGNAHVGGGVTVHVAGACWTFQE